MFFGFNHYIECKDMMISRSLVTKLLFFLTLSFFSSALFAQEANLDEGKAIFKGNCATCHNKNMKDKMTGPALGGVEERWEGREELLYAWIRNSQAVIATGDAYAVSLYKEYNNSVMTAFPNLTDDQIRNMLAYIDGVYKGTYGPTLAVVNPVGDTGAGAPKEGSNFLYFTLFLILAILAIVLARIVSNLRHMAQVREGGEVAPRATLMDVITSKGVVGFAVFSLVVLGGYTSVNNAIDLGRQQGYAPDQPIKFSHATHAGLQKIDCQYCHDGARRSKHSVIPAANTCMNCHKAIKYGSEYGTAELTKIYASVGYNPNNDTYIEDADGMDNADFENIYKKWIKEQFVEKKETEPRYEGNAKRLLAAAEEAAETQWDGIVTSLTNDQKEKIYGPIEWIRIHNLPDHAYFNHAQHVSVGKVECQTCHGPIEKMEVVAQHSPLSMGWCINCHRQTEVQFADNEYYQSYELYHEQIKNGERDKVTVEDIGGLECQKCHY